MGMPSKKLLKSNKDELLAYIDKLHGNHLAQNLEIHQRDSTLRALEAKLETAEAKVACDKETAQSLLETEKRAAVGDALSKLKTREGLVADALRSISLINRAGN